jgi:hypothetical protein
MHSFQHTSVFGSQKSAGMKSGEYVDDPWQRCLFLLKTATLEARNVLACCHGEKSTSDLSTTLLAWVSCCQYALSTPPYRMSD